MFDNEARQEQAALLAIVKAATGTWKWSRIANAVVDIGSAVAIIRGDWTGYEDAEAKELRVDAAGAESLIPEYLKLVESIEGEGARLITILDSDYPLNLRTIYNPPPFIFVRGDLTPADDRSIAVVGTRKPSEEGIDQAMRLAKGLASEGVTVLSGMARGIDTAAHSAALEAGGRTVAVMGTGIRERYPTENAALADRIEKQGALVSQFWPDAPPRGPNFLMRNVVTSGAAEGTVVIEATSASGARNQARRALEHGKLCFLVNSLVLSEDWAREYAEKRGAIVIDRVEDILDRLVLLSREGGDPEQLRLG